MSMVRIFSCLIISVSSCSGPGAKAQAAHDGLPAPTARAIGKPRMTKPQVPLRPLERQLAAAGLTEVAPQPGLQVRLIYATDQNFTGRVIYTDLHRCFLRPEAARRLREAAATLREGHPAINLRVVDCARPVSVQRVLWAAHPNPAHVANPETGTSAHNHGCAVDLTLASGEEALEMGTEIDEFSAGGKLTIQAEERLCRSGELASAACTHRRLLRAVMTGAGFVPYEGEWWHFNGCDRDRFGVIP